MGVWTRAAKFSGLAPGVLLVLAEKVREFNGLDAGVEA
jgi:hypothetical protein